MDGRAVEGQAIVAGLALIVEANALGPTRSDHPPQHRIARGRHIRVLHFCALHHRIGNP